MKKVVENIIKEVAVNLTEEFDRNFQRKAFFDQKWPETKHNYRRGSLMMRTGKLRRSIIRNISGNEIRWRSSVPYASIHNEGGEIEVTEKMKKFFWAMYYKSAGAISKTSSGRVANIQRNQKLNEEAERWKYMALMKVGTKMKIEERRFIGWHPDVDRAIHEVVSQNMIDYNEALKRKLKPKK